jgi:hypothetical protein
LQTTRIQIQKHTKHKLVSLVCFGISKHKKIGFQSHTMGINPLKHKKPKPYSQITNYNKLMSYNKYLTNNTKKLING